jgi:outer membrane protein, adhesin transport system
MTLREAVEAASQQHPAVAAAQANRRATSYELLQSQGRKLPRVDLEADIGEEKVDRPFGQNPDVNDVWRTRRQGAISLSQPIFDGWERINDIYRNAARVDSASFRVLARSEALALDAVEAYINVRRSQTSLDLAEDNARNHRRLLGRINEQVAAGKVPASDTTQVQERLAGADATTERVRQALREAEINFARVVGQRPTKLQPASYPKLVSMSREAAVATGLSKSAQLGAANADIDTARYTYQQAKSTDYPTVNLEMRGSAGSDLGGTPGKSNELAAKIVLRWNLFDGLISRNKQMEFAERWSQAKSEAEDRRRAVSAEIERSLVAYHAGGPRIEALRRQAKAATAVVTNYETEYGVGKRSILDVLNAENSKFNVRVELATTEAIHIFSAYRVLGSMGSLLDAVRVGAPDGMDIQAQAKVQALGRRGNAFEPLRVRDAPGPPAPTK